MKRWIAALMIVLLLTSSFSVLSVSAASLDIRDGVLVKYSGSDASVTLPDTVRAVGASAFAGNTTLRSVSLPATVNIVGERAFYGCTALQSVSGGENVTSVGDMAFHATPYLNTSTDKYFMLGHVLLWYNGTADSVTIPSHCTAVASYAFLRCDYLQSFTAYEGLIGIGTGAFFGCTKLSTVNLPDTVSSVGAYAFEGTPYLTSLGEYATVGDGVLVKYAGSSSQVALPNTVKRIAPHAFVSSKLRAVTIPDSVYSIDSYAFADCTGLETVELPEGLVNIGDGAFRGCKSLSSLITPTTLSYIGQSAFSGDAALHDAAISGDDLTISYGAFRGCTGMQYALLSDGVSALYDEAFAGCTALEGVSVPPSVQQVAASSLNGCNNVMVSCAEGSAAASALSSHTVNTDKGNVLLRKNLTIMDATVIQYYLVRLKNFDGAQLAIADVNYDADVDVLDAYLVQMMLVDLA